MSVFSPVVKTFRNLFFSQKTLETSTQRQKFLESRAAFLVQKSLTEYSQARANMMFSTLMREPKFQDSYEKARWDGYPASLAMVAELMLAQWRQTSGLPAAVLAKDILHSATKLLESYPLPEGAAPDHWTKALQDLEADLARAQLAAPRMAHEMVKQRALEIFEALPFHTAIKKHDYEMFENTLAFHLTEIAGQLEEHKLPSQIT